MKRDGRVSKKTCVFVPVLLIVAFIVACLSYTVYLNHKYKNTRVIRLTGGLGNQLYQVAFGYALEKKTGMKVLYDTLLIDKEVELAKENKKNRVWVRWYFDKFDVNVEQWKASFLEKLFVRKKQVIKSQRKKM